MMRVWRGEYSVEAEMAGVVVVGLVFGDVASSFGEDMLEVARVVVSFLRTILESVACGLLVYGLSSNGMGVV